MKTLKFEESLVESIINGTRTSTWRLHDDKDLCIDDQVEFISRGDGQVFGKGTISQLVIKKLKDATSEELRDHNYSSHEEMYGKFKRYYGDEVGPDTTVKMLHFNFESYAISKAPQPELPKLKEVKIYADGGSRGNPGPSASGFVIMDMHNKVFFEAGIYLGITTNNQAEYQALRFGLEQAKKMGVREVHAHMDSLLVVNQMKGIFKVKNRDLWPIHEAIKLLCQDFSKVSFTHVPRELNKLADAEVNKCLDAQNA